MAIRREYKMASGTGFGDALLLFLLGVLVLRGEALHPIHPQSYGPFKISELNCMKKEDMLAGFHTRRQSGLLDNLRLGARDLSGHSGSSVASQIVTTADETLFTCRFQVCTSLLAFCSRTDF